MSEAEVLELIAMHGDNAVSSFTVFLSLLFGYMTVAYFAAGKLSGVQVTLTSLIYLLAVIAWVVTVITNTHSFETLAAEYPDFIKSPLWALPWSLMVVVVTGAATTASLYFMHDLRRQDKR